MKGLLLKDCYTLLRQAKVFALLIVVFAVVPGSSMAGFAIVYAGMLPMTALAYDERAKWDSLAAMMPYSVRDIVLSKYLLGYAGIAAAGILSAAARLVMAAARQTGGEAEASVSILLLVLVATLILSVEMPLMFRFGVEKGRLAFLALAVVAVLGSYLGVDAAREMPVAANAAGLMAIAAAVTLLLTALSIALSVALYKRQRA